MKFNSAEAKTAQKKTRMTPGIHENVTLVGISIEKSESGAQYIEFNFENDKNEIQNQRVWEPNTANPRQKEKESIEDAQQREINSKLIHLTHILETFLPSDKAAVAANSFEEFCKITKAKLEPVMKNTKLRIKLLLDNNNTYTVFPQFTPYMEKQVDGVKSGLYISKWEMENRMSKADAPAGDSALLGTLTPNDDLPF